MRALRSTVAADPCGIILRNHPASYSPAFKGLGSGRCPRRVPSICRRWAGRYRGSERGCRCYQRSGLPCAPRVSSPRDACCALSIQADAAKASGLAPWRSGARPGHRGVGVILPDPAGSGEVDMGHRVCLQTAVVQAGQAGVPTWRPPDRLSWAVGWGAVPPVALRSVCRNEAIGEDRRHRHRTAPPRAGPARLWCQDPRVGRLHRRAGQRRLDRLELCRPSEPAATVTRAALGIATMPTTYPLCAGLAFPPVSALDGLHNCALDGTHDQ